MDAGDFMMGGGSGEFDLSGGVGIPGVPQLQHQQSSGVHNGSLDPTSMMSPLSSSPLDDFEVGVHEDYSGRGTGSLHNSPYGTSDANAWYFIRCRAIVLNLKDFVLGTPGMHIPGNFYSMSMPVHPTAGFGAIDQTKLMGSQPSSFGAYGSGSGLGLDMLDEEGQQQYVSGGGKKYVPLFSILSPNGLQN